MKQKEIESLLADSSDFIEERKILATNQLQKNSTYKRKYAEHLEFMEKLIQKYSREEIEKLEYNIVSLNELEENYIYLQGFVDGILLKEIFLKSNNK